MNLHTELTRIAEAEPVRADADRAMRTAQRMKVNDLLLAMPEIQPPEISGPKAITPQLGFRHSPIC